MRILIVVSVFLGVVVLCVGGNWIFTALKRRYLSLAERTRGWIKGGATVTSMVITMVLIVAAVLGLFGQSLEACLGIAVITVGIFLAGFVAMGATFYAIGKAIEVASLMLARLRVGMSQEGWAFTIVIALVVTALTTVQLIIHGLS